MTADPRYTDWKTIGQGAFGEVCRAYDTLLNSTVAIKLLKKKYGQAPRLVEALYQEVNVSRKLQHRNICAIYDVYQGERGVGIVMELIKGIPFSDWLKAHQDQLLETAKQRLTLLTTLTRALVVAHEGDVIHRDLKPDNVFLRGGSVKQPVIMDFGTAIIGDVVDGQVAGTPRYMSPEQWEAPDKVDQRSDLFALGTMAFEVFTGLLPPTSLRRILKTRQPPRVEKGIIPLPSSFCVAVPPALNQLILQMISYQLSDRPDSAQAVLEILESLDLNPKPSLDKLGERDANWMAQHAVTIADGSFPFSFGIRKARRVHLSAYRITRYLVTNREYRAFVESTGYRKPPFLDDPKLGRSDHPVVGVTHDDANTFAAWAGGRLPSEAEWEQAAKGSDGFADYPWGSDPFSATRANLDEVTDSTSPVGAFSAGTNPLGLHDMCGNVWEWCRDSWEPEFSRSLQTGDTNPVNDMESDQKVIRGGAFDSVVQHGRCDFRHYADSNTQAHNIGFRLAFDTEGEAVNASEES
ncbi:MAG: SUMF1/EgtB/PvdO family nonheme iron enzyme [Magnetococcales bacterium]|nr:SUMF1/EgtB/PvdO family nonheme iron enzyme [Magnetococcales bacterium]